MEVSNINNTPVGKKEISYDMSDIKKEQNKNIIEAHLRASSHDTPTVISLLLRTTIAEINKNMPSSVTENTNTSTIQKAYESNLDMSPKANADLILKGATSFFNAYKEQNSDLTEDEALTQFIDVIRNGINTGFVQTRNVLESLSALEDEIARNIDVTYDTVQTGLNDFSKTILTVINESTTQ